MIGISQYFVDDNTLCLCCAGILCVHNKFTVLKKRDKNILYSLTNLVKYNLPDNYYQNYDEDVRGITLTDLKDISSKVVKPDEVNWFVVGDKVKIRAKLDKLGFDKIIEIDADGNPITPPIDIKEEKIKN